jgi:1-acyl-sn-glycerol-3-phosphate acyltransferase
VPCAILGTYEALPITAKFPRPTPITVKIGEPIYLLKEFEDIIDDVQLQEGIFKIRNAIKELLNAK